MKIIVLLLLMTFSISLKAENYIGSDSSSIVNETIKNFLCENSNECDVDLKFYEIIKKYKAKDCYLDFGYWSVCLEDSTQTFHKDGPNIHIKKCADGTTKVYCYKDSKREMSGMLFIDVRPDEILIHKFDEKLIAAYSIENNKCTTFEVRYYSISLNGMKSFAKTHYGIDGTSHSNIIRLNGESFEYCLDLSRTNEHIYIVEVCKLLATTN